MSDLRTRYGRFSIHFDHIERQPDLCIKILSNMLVIRAEALYGSLRIEYEALSYLFDSVRSVF